MISDIWENKEKRIEWETYGLTGLVSLWAKWRDVLTEKLETPQKYSSDLKVFYNNSYYLLNAHFLQSTIHTRLHLIFIIAPRDVIFVIQMKKTKVQLTAYLPRWPKWGGSRTRAPNSGWANTHVLLYFIILSLSRMMKGYLRLLALFLERMSQEICFIPEIFPIRARCHVLEWEVPSSLSSHQSLGLRVVGLSFFLPPGFPAAHRKHTFSGAECHKLQMVRPVDKIWGATSPRWWHGHSRCCSLSTRRTTKNYLWTRHHQKDPRPWGWGYSTSLYHRDQERLN